MKLEVDLFELNLNAAKMQGLEAVLAAIRLSKTEYQKGLDIACEYVQYNKGQVSFEGEVTHLTLNNESAHCFKPYPDIDLFYYES